MEVKLKFDKSKKKQLIDLTKAYQETQLAEDGKTPLINY